MSHVISAVSNVSLRRSCAKDAERLAGQYGWLLLAQFLAFWPVARWYLARLGDGSDEPWGLLALITVVLISLRPAPRAVRPALFLPLLLMGAYILSYALVPPLVRGILAACAIASIVSQRSFGRRFYPALWGLAVLSLPLLPTLQFYLGYPLRAATALIVAKLLQFSGLAVVSSGATLIWRGAALWLDAPCSGIKMLWGALYLTFTLVCLKKLSLRRSCLAASFASCAIFAGNVMRAYLLFFCESKIVCAPDWAHSAIGLVVFISAALQIMWLISRFEKHGSQLEGPAQKRASRTSSAPRRVFFAYGALGLFAASLPFMAGPAPAPLKAASFPGWPARFENEDLQSLPLSARELKFKDEFPGLIARFKTPSREVIMRFVSVPTRRLHPAADCLRGVGYRISPLPARREKDGRQFGCVSAVRGGEKLRVCELIEDQAGKSWSDVSAWYWAAQFGQTQGPWFAYTVSSSRERSD